MWSTSSRRSGFIEGLIVVRLDDLGKWLGSLAGLFGLGLIAASLQFPVHTDEAKARYLRSPAGCENDRPIAGWFDQIAALDTLRHPLQQSGASLILAAVTCAALTASFGWRGTGLPSTPSSRLPFFVIALGAVAIHWAAFIYSLGLDLRRGELPWCQDSIGIPIFTMTPIYGILALIVLAVGLVLVRSFGQLPVCLFAKFRPRTVRAWAVNLTLALFAIAMITIAVVDAPTSNFLATPSYILLAYVFLASRSALLVP